MNATPSPIIIQKAWKRVAHLAGGRQRLWDHRFMLLAIVFIGIASRIPFQSQVLYHWDSVNFAMATEQFDLARGKPQPPGYPLYVGLGRLLNMVTGDPQISFVVLSILFSGLGGAAIYLLGKEMFDQRSGLVASALFLSSPLVWFYGEVALPHMLDAFFVTFCALLLYLVCRGQDSYALPAGVALGAAGGLRPQTLVFLTPLAVFAFARGSKRKVVAAGLGLAIITGLWLLPLLWLSGGLERYQQITNEYSSGFFRLTSIFHGGGVSGLFGNIDKVTRYTALGLGLSFIPYLTWTMNIRRVFQRGLRDDRTWFLLSWIIPPVAFYVLVHMGQQGLTFVFLPALLIVSAASLVRLCRSSILRRSILSVVVSTNVVVFLLLPAQLGSTRVVKIPNWSAIRGHDVRLLGAIEAIKSNFKPQETLILAANWRHMEYYLPEYPLLKAWPQPTDRLPNGDPPSIPGSDLQPLFPGGDPGYSSIRNVVTVDDDLATIISSPSSPKLLAIPGGRSIPYLSLKANEVVTYDASSALIFP